MQSEVTVRTASSLLITYSEICRKLVLSCMSEFPVESCCGCDLSQSRSLWDQCRAVCISAASHTDEVTSISYFHIVPWKESTFIMVLQSESEFSCQVESEAIVYSYSECSPVRVSLLVRPFFYRWIRLHVTGIVRLWTVVVLCNTCMCTAGFQVDTNMWMLRALPCSVDLPWLFALFFLLAYEHSN